MSKREIKEQMSFDSSPHNIYSPSYSQDSDSSLMEGEDSIDEELSSIFTKPRKITASHTETISIVEHHNNNDRGASIDSVELLKFHPPRDRSLIGDFEDPQSIDTSSFNNEIK